MLKGHVAPDVDKCRANYEKEPLGEQFRADLEALISKYGLVGCFVETAEHRIDIDIVKLPPTMKDILTCYGSVWVKTPMVELQLDVQVAEPANLSVIVPEEYNRENYLLSDYAEKVLHKFWEAFGFKIIDCINDGVYLITPKTEEDRDKYGHLNLDYSKAQQMAHLLTRFP